MAKTSKTLSAGSVAVPPDWDPWNSTILWLCRTDGEGNVLASTPGFQDLLGDDGKNPLPFPLSEFIHPEDRPAFLDHLKRMIGGQQQMERRMVRLISSGGRVWPMEAVGEPWLQESQPRSAILVWWERTEGDDAIFWQTPDERESFWTGLKNFIGNLFDPVVLLNTEGRIIHINQAVLELTGYRRAEIMGHPVACLFENSPDKISQAMLRFAKLMRRGEMHDVPAQWRDREGRPVAVSLSGSVMRSNSGELIGMVVVGRDERKNALLAALEKKNEELSRLNQELQRLDQMKDDVLSLVGHELRAPLANILGYAEFLNEWQLSPEERKEFTRVIYQESQHLRRLVNDILDLSRMEAGRMFYNYVSDSINRVVHEAVKSLRVDLEKKLIQLELKLDDQLEPLEFDPDRIQQVITNLLHNAIKFSPPGKHIRVITEAIEGGIRLSVADEGPGIEADQMTRIFNKFEQIIDIRHHHEGAGLGLAIAKRIIEEGHKGRIGVESRGKDQGAVFWFTLPEKRV